MKKQILYMLCATALLSSCHIYKSYDRPEDSTTSGLYRDPASENDTLVSDTTNFGNLPWREVFTDPQLQSLIEAGLNQNTDLLSAAQNVKAAQASLMSARLAYAPSLGLSPQGTISSFDKNAATKTYSLLRNPACRQRSFPWAGGWCRRPGQWRTDRRSWSRCRPGSSSGGCR